MKNSKFKMKNPANVAVLGALAAFIFHFSFFISPPASHAFPPAPPHRIYGLVRDEYGDPITVTGAQIIFEPVGGTAITGPIVPGLDPGVNYRLDVPMDSGTAPDAYKPTALKPTLPFRIRVKIGQVTYLPIQMTGNFASLGQPAGSTRIDLTLGEDSDNDGLPDAWERLLIAMLGGNLTLADIRPNDDSDNDGINNINEYYAGTFAFDPADGFRLVPALQPNGRPLLEFTVINPRTYTVHASTNMVNWTPISLKIPANGPSDAARASFNATDIRLLQVEPQVASTNVNWFYKVQVQ